MFLPKKKTHEKAGILVNIHPRKLTCPLTWGHFKRTGLSSLNVSFSGEVIFPPGDKKHLEQQLNNLNSLFFLYSFSKQKKNRKQHLSTPISHDGMHLRGLALDSLDSWHFFEALLGPEAELTETDLQKLMVATREYSEMLDWSQC